MQRYTVYNLYLVYTMSQGTGQVQGGGAVDELLVGLSKGGQAKRRKNTEQKFSSSAP